VHHNYILPENDDIVSLVFQTEPVFPDETNSV